MTEPTDAGGTTLLRDYLNSQRKHVLGIIEGLDEQAMRRPVLPSGWTCLGLVNHLALDVERFWFRAAVAAEQAVIDDLAVSQEDAWHAGPDVSVEAVLKRYRDEIERANAIIQATSIDAAPACGPTSSATGAWTTCGRSSCTSSPRRPATLVTSTQRVS